MKRVGTMNTSDFPWRPQRDDKATPFFYNVVSGESVPTSDDIPLPDGWHYDDSDDRYYNFELKKISQHLPGQLIETGTLLGYPYKMGRKDEDGEQTYQHKLTKQYWKESAITLPDGWKRGKTFDGEIYYYNEEEGEYSYRLPGAFDKPLRDPELVYGRLGYVEQELSELKYHMFHREVLSRCEQVVTYALAKRVGTDRVEQSLPDETLSFPPYLFRMNLYQLLNLLTARTNLGLPADISETRLRVFSALLGLKKADHAVVHKQILHDEDLERIMLDIRAALEDDDDEVDQQTFDLMEWICENHKEYLKKGKRKTLEDNDVVFPWGRFFPHEEGSEESKAAAVQHPPRNEV